jgi:hypothetical protein
MKGSLAVAVVGLLVGATTPLSGQSLPVNINVADLRGLNPVGGSLTTYNYYWVDCKSLPLAAASGLPGGGEHQYKFQGVCSHLLIHSTSSSTTVVGLEVSGSNDQTIDNVGKGFVVASAQFDPSTGTYTEAFKVQTDKGTHELESRFKCGADPVVGKTSCVVVAMKADPDLFPGWFNAASALKRPLLLQHATLDQATTLSKTQSDLPKSSPPPPPPSPTPKPAPREARIAAAAVSALDNMILVTKPAQGATTAGRLLVEVRVGQALVKSFTVNGVMVRQVQLEWQSRRDGTGRLTTAPWVPQDVQVPVGWAGKDGTATLARATLDAAKLSGFTRWRVRATIPGTSIAPSGWVEFQHTP